MERLDSRPRTKVCRSSIDCAADLLSHERFIALLDPRTSHVDLTRPGLPIHRCPSYVQHRLFEYIRHEPFAIEQHASTTTNTHVMRTSRSKHFSAPHLAFHLTDTIVFCLGLTTRQSDWIYLRCHMSKPTCIANCMQTSTFVYQTDCANYVRSSIYYTDQVHITPHDVAGAILCLFNIVLQHVMLPNVPLMRIYISVVLHVHSVLSSGLSNVILVTELRCKTSRDLKLSYSRNGSKNSRKTKCIQRDSNHETYSFQDIDSARCTSSTIAPVTRRLANYTTTHRSEMSAYVSNDTDARRPMAHQFHNWTQMARRALQTLQPEISAITRLHRALYHNYLGIDIRIRQKYRDYLQDSRKSRPKIALRLQNQENIPGSSRIHQVLNQQPRTPRMTSEMKNSRRKLKNNLFKEAHPPALINSTRPLVAVWVTLRGSLTGFLECYA